MISSPQTEIEIPAISQFVQIFCNKIIAKKKTKTPKSKEIIQTITDSANLNDKHIPITVILVSNLLLSIDKELP